jgi:RNA polymerase sigma-70 factor, ECF subfamily
MNTDDLLEMNRRGRFDARYLAFLETIAQLRPKLHRYCTRMTGSVLDGEDIVQDALFQAYRKLETFDESRSLSPWLFRIAHNRCIDVLRRRELQRDAEAEAAGPEVIEPIEPPGPALGRAVEQLVLTLPPMERACVLLKDVFDYSLEEIAELVDSTVGGVKAALNRGRTKLSAAPALTPEAGGAAASASRRKPPSAETRRVLHLYIERFNRRDWDGLRELIAADAKLRVADCFDGKFVDSPYLGEYGKSGATWRLALGEIDGEEAVIVLRLGEAGEWIPVAPISVEFGRDGSDGSGGNDGSGGIDGNDGSDTSAGRDGVGERITRIADYVHCAWVLEAATYVRVEKAALAPAP